jgi:hypothetical protein
METTESMLVAHGFPVPPMDEVNIYGNQLVFLCTRCVPCGLLIFRDYLMCTVTVAVAPMRNG